MKLIDNIVTNIRNKKNNIRVSLKSEINNCRLHGNNRIARGSVLNNVQVGMGTYISGYCNLYSTKIGKYSSIASYVKTIVGTHPTKTYVSTHPAFFSTIKQAGFTYVEQQKFEEYEYVNNKEKLCVSIGNDVWIGQDVNIMQGIAINDGAIIASGTLVNKDVPPYSIVAGVPGRVIKYRFNETDIEYLLKLKWWDKDMSWIIEHSEYFDDITRLKKYLEDKNNE